MAWLVPNYSANMKETKVDGAKHIQWRARNFKI